MLPFTPLYPYLSPIEFPFLGNQINFWHHPWVTLTVPSCINIALKVPLFKRSNCVWASPIKKEIYGPVLIDPPPNGHPLQTPPTELKIVRTAIGYCDRDRCCRYWISPTFGAGKSSTTLSLSLGFCLQTILFDLRRWGHFPGPFSLLPRLWLPRQPSNVLVRLSRCNIYVYTRIYIYLSTTSAFREM